MVNHLKIPDITKKNNPGIGFFHFLVRIEPGSGNYHKNSGTGCPQNKEYRFFLTAFFRDIE
jgi:hypothetical protein